MNYKKQYRKALKYIAKIDAKFCSMLNQHRVMVSVKDAKIGVMQLRMNDLIDEVNECHQYIAQLEEKLAPKISIGIDAKSALNSLEKIEGQIHQITMYDDPTPAYRLKLVEEENMNLKIQLRALTAAIKTNEGT